MLCELIGVLSELGNFTIMAFEFGHKLERKAMCHVVFHHDLHGSMASVAKLFVPCKDERILVLLHGE